MFPTQRRGHCCPLPTHPVCPPPPQKYPPSATTLHFEFYAEPGVEVKVDKRVSDRGHLGTQETFGDMAESPKTPGPSLTPPQLPPQATSTTLHYIHIEQLDKVSIAGGDTASIGGPPPSAPLFFSVCPHFLSASRPRSSPQISESPSEIMESLTKMYSIPKDKQVSGAKMGGHLRNLGGHTQIREGSDTPW